jgi:phosphoglycerate dehydrogenase-like enzyme
VANSNDLHAALTSTATLFGDSQLNVGLSPVIHLEAASPNDALADRIHKLGGFFAVVAGAESYTAELLEGLPDLCLIARSGVGFDQIDLEAASRLGIHVTTTPGVNAQGVAEHAVTLLLQLTHRVAYYDARVRNGEWRDGDFFSEIQGMTIGIIGFGNVGRATAALLHAFGARIIAFDAMPIIDVPSYVTVASSTTEMLPLCQAISLHTPLLDSTRGLIGGDELALLPRGAFIVNTSRGGIIDEAALVFALRSGHIAGAGLDVFAAEPPQPGDPLLALHSCIFSPHSASLGAYTIESMTRMIATQLNAVAAGSTPSGLISAPSVPRFPLMFR